MHWQPNPLCHVIQITHDNIDLRVDINLVKTFDRYMQLFKIYLLEKFWHVFGTKKTLNIWHTEQLHGTSTYHNNSGIRSESYS